VHRKLISRLELLEARMIPKQVHPWVFISCPLPDERLAEIAPDERLVLDYFRHDGLLISAAERITSDPKDQGRRCQPGGYLEDVIRELHEDCWYRDRDGGCNTCKNTPIANT
jgi:hypothetical protein